MQVARRPGARPRVLLVSRIYAPESAAATFRLGALVRALSGRARVGVLTTTPPPALRARGAAGRRPAPAPDGVTVSRWPALRDATGYVRGYLPYLSFDLPLALRLLGARRPDVVVVEPPPTTGAVTRVALGVRALPGRTRGHDRVPYVYYAADVWSDATASMGAPAPVVTAMRWVERFALRGARDVVAVSEGVAERVRAIAGGDTPVTVVPNGIDTDVFTPDGPRHPEAPATPYLVYAGTASEWQGAEIFAEAMREVVREEPGARLVFLGQGSSWPVLRRVADELPRGALELRPLAPVEEAAAWQRGAAAALVSVRPGVGYDFAYPTKVIAALACGTPVVFAGPGPAAADVAAHDLGEAVGYDVMQVAAAMLRAVRAGREPHSTADAARRVAWVREHRSLSATGRRAAAVVLPEGAEEA
ncbi:glycosyltransferase [Ornithinimicrobium pekingense]|uniref:D-inositol 3-phosphate glycosyltransferase n=1 Tax=Ornithinimicrobium pekingense TaxID=384677 RepID=A0ABQ2F822_9MICO|nr:glycosyltransferase [Ornithinimicrobium pekingense]GGK70547.1 glycosyl transferase [Ornithinimicrobium pekingense]